MKNKIIVLTFTLFLAAGVLGFGASARAEIYFYFDAEDEVVGATLPLYYGAPANFCQTECGGDGEKGTTQEIGGTLQGDKYFVWQTVNSQHDCRTEIKSDSLPDSGGWSITLEIDKPYYLAYYMRFDRIDGKDIWKVGNIQYADKGVELYSSSVRLLTSRGQWTHMAANQSHHYTVWGGIMKGDNDVVWGQNRNGYSPSNPIQLEYERWYAVVMEFKLSCSETGSLAVYIDGVKTEEYLNVNTIDSTCSPVIGRIQVGGTMGQPTYDTPAHYRKFDALILTDNLQDIVNGGYLQDPEGNDTTSPYRSDGSPTGTLSSGTTSTTISLTTDETAVCKYSETAGTDYDSMTLQLSSGQANTHTTTVSGLSDGDNKTYYIRCQDESNNQNTDDFEISFSVASPEYYVSPTGTATWPSCSNTNTPCSAETAMQNAVAGDVVYFRGGTYNTGESSYKFPIYEPSNSGTSGNPITFIAYPGETPVFNGMANDAQKFCTIFHSGGKDYIIYDGFTIQADNGHGMGRIYIGALHGSDPYNCIVRNCIFNGGDTLIDWGDNAEGLRIDDSFNTLVQNCKFYNYKTTMLGHNTGAIKMYTNNGTTIENCEIYDCGSGIYPKSGNNNCVFRYNYIHNCRESVPIRADASSTSINGKFYHNVVVNSNADGVDCNAGGIYSFDNWDIYNNTLYTAGSIDGLTYAKGLHCDIYNNIIQGHTSKQLIGRPGATLQGCDHNCFGDSSLLIITRKYAGDMGLYYALADWQSSGELASAWDAGCGVSNNPGCGSLASNPEFLNSSGTMSQLDDFRLASNSPCKSAGRNSEDMGANIDLVGVNAGQADTTSPSRSNSQPTGTLSSGTTSTTISLTTDETAVCKYSETAGTDYDSMTLQLSSGQANTHTTTVSGLSDGDSKTYYVRCQDESNNQNTDDFEISFNVASSTTYSISNFINLVTNWLSSGTGLESDVNGDGVVNTRDLGIMMSNWQ